MDSKIPNPELAVDAPSSTDTLIQDDEPKRRRPRAQGALKSRTGCRTCKKRHRKCDETRPGCLQCSVSGWKCDYLDDASSAAPAQVGGQAPSQSSGDGRIVAVAAHFNKHAAPLSGRAPASHASSLSSAAFLPGIVRPPPSFMSELKPAETSRLGQFKFNMQMVSLANSVPVFEKVLIRAIYTEPAIRHVGIASAVAFNHDHWASTSPPSPEVLKRILHGCNLAIRELARRVEESPPPSLSSLSSSSRPPDLPLLVGTVLAAVSWHLGDCEQLTAHLGGMLRILLERRGAMMVPSQEVEDSDEIPVNENSRQATLGAAYITWVLVMDKYLAWDANKPADELDAAMLHLKGLLDRSRELDMTETGYIIVARNTARSTYTWENARKSIEKVKTKKINISSARGKEVTAGC